MRTVLITGCSSGIGRALAQEFHSRRFIVHATARRLETLKSLEKAGMRIHSLDVNEPESIDNVISQITAEQDCIDILVNNAGFQAIDPLIDIPIEKMRLQFETNVISILSMIQAVAPLMIGQKQGLIVNFGSISGILTSPFSGAYCASKSAVHSLSDALRMELTPFNIRVVTVQPGGVVSNLGDTAKSGISISGNGPSAYSKITSALEKRAMASQVGAMPVQEFAKQLIDRALRKNTPAVIRLGKNSRLMPFLNGVLPLRTIDKIMTKKFCLDRLP